MKHIITASALGALMILSSASAQAGEDMVAGYLRSGDGTVVRDGSGDCVRTGDKTSEKLEECGYKVEVVVENTPAKTTVDIVEDKVVLEHVSIPNLTFDFDSAELTAEDKAILDNAVSKLAPYKDAFRAQTAHVEIVGHTDSTGPEAYNQKLSERRANAVADYLANQLGADRSRMIVSGKGESDPIADNSTREGRAKNRRVEVEIIQN